jgi:hypothetical protein
MRGINHCLKFKPREQIAAACDNLSGLCLVQLVCLLYGPKSRPDVRYKILHVLKMLL